MYLYPRRKLTFQQKVYINIQIKEFLEKIIFSSKGKLINIKAGV